MHKRSGNRKPTTSETPAVAAIMLLTSHRYPQSMLGGVWIAIEDAHGHIDILVNDI
jgi:hypothetical protein